MQPSRKTRRARAASLDAARSDVLETIVRERIATRLGRRIRNLAVGVESGVIRITGQCSTYYSKQLAQHAALGVVEDEVIDNRIEVAVPQVATRV